MSKKGNQNVSPGRGDRIKPGAIALGIRPKTDQLAPEGRPQLGSDELRSPLRGFAFFRRLTPGANAPGSMRSPRPGLISRSASLVFARFAQIVAVMTHRWRALTVAVMLIVVCGQLWWPRSATAQGPSGAPRTQKTRFQNSPNKANASDLRPDFNIEPRRNPPAGREDEAAPQRAPAGGGGLPGQLIQGMPNLNVDQFVSPQGLSSSINVWLAVTVLSLAPAILMMSTCFVRFIVVLSLLRQALGTPNLPPNQVLMGLSLFLTLLVMAPVWNESYQQGIRPYTDPPSGASRPSFPVVFENTVRPLRRFMSQQIEKAHNPDAVWMFVEYQRPAKGSIDAENWQEPETYDDVSLTVLLPAYLLSELKTAFLIGFQIYLPFLIIDLVVAAVLMSMGLSMLPPTQISLPFKLLLFVLIDGWTLTVGMLIESVRAVT